MLGVSRTVRDGKTVAYEFLMIRPLEEGRLGYVSKPSGQPENSFPLLRMADGEVVFEDLEHDFPQRIIYRRGEGGGLPARMTPASKACAAAPYKGSTSRSAASTATVGRTIGRTTGRRRRRPTDLVVRFRGLPRRYVAAKSRGDPCVPAVLPRRRVPLSPPGAALHPDRRRRRKLRQDDRASGHHRRRRRSAAPADVDRREPRSDDPLAAATGQAVRRGGRDLAARPDAAGRPSSSAPASSCSPRSAASTIARSAIWPRRSARRERWWRRSTPGGLLVANGDDPIVGRDDQAAAAGDSLRALWLRAGKRRAGRRAGAGLAARLDLDGDRSRVR